MMRSTRNLLIVGGVLAAAGLVAIVVGLVIFALVHNG